MRRGDVYDARLNPIEGSEQGGVRPVVIVSRNAINQYSSVVVVVPMTSATNIKKLYPYNVLIEVGDGGLTAASVALGGQMRAISKTRLLRKRGTLSLETMQAIERALRITLNLPI